VVTTGGHAEGKLVPCVVCAGGVQQRGLWIHLIEVPAETKELLQLKGGERSRDREVSRPCKVGGIHQVVSETNLNLFADRRQKEKGGKLVSFVVSKKNSFFVVGDAVQSCRPEDAERMQKWKKK
jgi:hypothetical protein